MLNIGRILVMVLCRRIQLYLSVATHGHSTISNYLPMWLIPCDAKGYDILRTMIYSELVQLWISYSLTKYYMSVHEMNKL
jgi:hypothetical protein